MFTVVVGSEMDCTVEYSTVHGTQVALHGVRWLLYCRLTTVIRTSTVLNYLNYMRT